jgi:ectoine hydroxylase-related dioxygenase (phytanoyl-CoA dioxygenase family)
MPTATNVEITPEQLRDYREKGFFVLDAIIPPEHLDMLREEADIFIDKMHAEMDKTGRDVIGISHRGKRYFISRRYKESARLHEFIFSDLMANICRATLGPNAWLFHEQYVIKAAEVGMKFAWHQDSGYLPHKHKPYLTTWCALDDMTEANGTVYMLPYDRAGTRDRLEHIVEAGSNDLVGYHGADPGEAVVCPAGSIAVFSSTCFHRSGVNTTSKMRRVYLPQYSSEPIMSEDGTKVWAQADEFLRDGNRVR